MKKLLLCVGLALGACGGGAQQASYYEASAASCADAKCDSVQALKTTCTDGELICSADGKSAMVCENGLFSAAFDCIGCHVVTTSSAKREQVADAPDPVGAVSCD